MGRGRGQLTYLFTINTFIIHSKYFPVSHWLKLLHPLPSPDFVDEGVDNKGCIIFFVFNHSRQSFLYVVISGHVPFNQNFQKFRVKIEWNRNFPEIHFENFDSPLEVVLLSGNLEIPEISCSIWHF